MYSSWSWLSKKLSTRNNCLLITSLKTLFSSLYLIKKIWSNRLFDETLSNSPSMLFHVFTCLLMTPQNFSILHNRNQLTASCASIVQDVARFTRWIRGWTAGRLQTSSLQRTTRIPDGRTHSVGGSRAARKSVAKGGGCLPPATPRTPTVEIELWPEVLAIILSAQSFKFVAKFLETFHGIHELIFDLFLPRLAVGGGRYAHLSWATCGRLRWSARHTAKNLNFAVHERLPALTGRGARVHAETVIGDHKARRVCKAKIRNAISNSSCKGYNLSD